jgi:hypothetical protein
MTSRRVVANAAGGTTSPPFGTPAKAAALDRIDVAQIDRAHLHLERQRRDLNYAKIGLPTASAPEPSVELPPPHLSCLQPLQSQPIRPRTQRIGADLGSNQGTVCCPFVARLCRQQPSADVAAARTRATSARSGLGHVRAAQRA